MVRKFFTPHKLRLINRLLLKCLCPFSCPLTIYKDTWKLSNLYCLLRWPISARQVNFFTAKINFFTAKVNFSTAKVNFSTAKLNFSTAKLNSSTAKLNSFTAKLNFFAAKLNSFAAKGNFPGQFQRFVSSQQIALLQRNLVTFHKMYQGREWYVD